MDIMDEADSVDVREIMDLIDSADAESCSDYSCCYPLSFEESRYAPRCGYPISADDWSEMVDDSTLNLPPNTFPIYIELTIVGDKTYLNTTALLWRHGEYVIVSTSTPISREVCIPAVDSEWHGLPCGWLSTAPLTSGGKSGGNFAAGWSNDSRGPRRLSIPCSTHSARSSFVRNRNVRLPHLYAHRHRGAAHQSSRRAGNAVLS